MQKIVYCLSLTAHVNMNKKFKTIKLKTQKLQSVISDQLETARK